MKPTSYIKSLPVRDRISISQPLGLDTINLGYNELPFKPTKQIALAIEKPFLIGVFSLTTPS